MLNGIFSVYWNSSHDVSTCSWEHGMYIYLPLFCCMTALVWVLSVTIKSILNAFQEYLFIYQIYIYIYIFFYTDKKLMKNNNLTPCSAPVVTPDPEEGKETKEEQ